MKMNFKKTFQKKYETPFKKFSNSVSNRHYFKKLSKTQKGAITPKKPPKPQKGQLSKDKAGLHSFPQGPLRLTRGGLIKAVPFPLPPPSHP
jgi:hypothetical protein